MRFLTAALLFVVSIVLVILGIGQRTVWAGPSEHRVHLKVAENQPYFLIPNSALVHFEGKPTITVKGSGNVFMASGRESDIEAWLGNESNAVVTFGGPSNKAVVEARSGVKSFISPVGSDLWRTETTGAGSVHLGNLDTGQENALLLAHDGIAAAPGDISIVWNIAKDFTLSNYLLIAGVSLLVIAFILNILSIIRLRRQRRPHRKVPKAPQGPRYKPKRSSTRYAAPKGRRSARNAAIAVPAGLITLSLLSGCAGLNQPQATPTATETSQAAQPPAALTPSQIRHILVETAYVAKLADNGTDRHSISNRFTGPALEVRSIHYYLQSRSKAIPKLPAISATASIALPAADKDWPRTFMAVTDAPDSNTAPQMLVFQQDSPRSNYKVWYTIELHQKTPKVASVELGAIPTEPDSGFLVMKPTDIVSHYGDLINNPTSSQAINFFDVSKDDFFKGIQQIQATNAASLKNGKIQFNHVLGDQNILGLNTMSNGALVALYMNDVTITKPKKSNQAIVVSGQEKILLGSAGSSAGISTTYGDMMLFFVPNTNGGRITLLGYTSGLIKVKAL